MSDKSEIEAIRAVTRYTQPCVQQQLGPEFKVAEVPLFESAKGKYVLFTDYAVLLSHLDEQAKRIAELEADVSGHLKERDRYAETLGKIAGGHIPPEFSLSPVDFHERIWVWSQQLARAALVEVKP